MTVALITAAGKGERMKQEIPKQFWHVDNKPVIIYTLEAFQKHPGVDAIMVVCLDGWHDILKAYAKQFHIDKLKWIVAGGPTGRESIYNGLNALLGECKADDLVLIHDSIRGMVSQDIISDCIVTAGKYGNAIAAIPCTEVMIISTDSAKSSQYIDRDMLKRTQTPQGFQYEKIMGIYKEATEKDITITAAPVDLMIELGEVVYLSKGSEKNLKITSVEDLDIFKALLHVKRDSYLID